MNQAPEKNATSISFKDANGVALDCQGWWAECEGKKNSCFVPIHRDGKVVALAVAAGDYDGIGVEVQNIAASFADAFNVKNTMAGELAGLKESGRAIIVNEMARTTECIRLREANDDMLVVLEDCTKLMKMFKHDEGQVYKTAIALINAAKATSA